MNYLAHLVLAEQRAQSLQQDPQPWLLGAMLGDFVKGKLPNDLYSDTINAAIRQHRQIDSRVDQHPRYQQRLQQMPTTFRRWAPILFDLVNDHFLALHWQRYHHLALQDFCDVSYQAFASATMPLPNNAQQLLTGLQTRNGLAFYHDINTIDTLLKRLSTRSAKHANLLQGQQIMRDFYDELLQDFFIVFNDMLTLAKQTSVAPQN